MQSPYKQGADDGMKFGIYLSALFFSSIFSPRFPLLGMVTIVLMIGVPVIIWRMQRRYATECGKNVTMPMLWMQGVMIFLCGMLISGVLLVIYMKWINPGFILQQWQAMAALGQSSVNDGMRQVGRIAAGMIENGLLPTPMAVVIEFFLLVVTSGSILSLILAAIITPLSRKKSLSLRP